MKKKKYITTSLLIIFTLLMSTNSVLAGEITTQSGDVIKVETTATVTPITLTVTIPTSMTFAVNPNIVEPITTVPASVVNKTKVPIDIAFIGIKSKESTTAKVVDNAKYTNWSSLNCETTESSIALGLKDDKGKQYWSTAEDIVTANPVDTTTYAPNEERNLSLMVKSGMAWSKATALSYDINLIIRLSEDSIKETVPTDIKFFEFDKSTGTLVRFRKDLVDAPTKVTIPSEIDGVSVTAIGNMGFYQSACVTEINIPRSVTSIGKIAFDFCTTLKNINIDSPTGSISGAPWGATWSNPQINWQATDAKFFDYEILSDKTIELKAYKSDLAGAPTAVIIPKEIEGMPVTSIGGYQSNTCFRFRDKITSVSIPETVTSITSSAFDGCSSLVDIKLPSSLDYIPTNGFKGCTSLETIELPNNLKGLYGGAFDGCTKLSSIKIPTTVTTLGSRVFNGCTSLKSLVLPEEVTVIDGHLFEGCTELTDFKLPSKVTEIGQNAFEGCTSLTTLNIHSTVTKVAYRAFFGCSKLAKINVDKPAGSLDLSDCGIPATTKINWKR